MSVYLSSNYEPEVRAFVAVRMRNVRAFAKTAPAIGWVRDINDDQAAIVGGVVLSRKSDWDADLSIALTPECRVTRAHLETLFRVAFEGYGLKRLTCLVARKNAKSRSLCERLGFRNEGALRRGFDGVQTAVVYGMSVDECRWIRSKT